jgi:drug/metabolite transporter (DMT)-like permease
MTADEQGRGSRLLGLAFVVLATACWSTSGIFIRRVIDGSGISPVGLAFWRDFATFAALLVGLAVFRPDLLRVKRADLPWFAAMGVAGIGLFHICWNTAVVTVGVSVATVLQANAPIIVTVLAWIIWREPLTGRKLAAVALAFVGTVLIARLDRLSGMELTLFGLLIGLASAVTYGSTSLFAKKLSRDYSQWTILVYAFGVGAAFLAPFQIGSASPLPLSGDVLGSFAALVLLTTVTGFGLYMTGLRRLQASVASITANTEVPFAALLAYIILGERLDLWQAVGAVLIVGGVVLLSLSNRAVERRAHRPVTGEAG